MAQVMIVDNVAPEAAQVLQQEGHQVKRRWRAAKHRRLIAACTGCQGLICSVTKVTAQFLAAARLAVVGQTGIGVDNIDIETASKRGVL